MSAKSIRLKRLKVLIRDGAVKIRTVSPEGIIHYQWQIPCKYCQKILTGYREMTVDHVVPRFWEGTHDLDNLVISCEDCNTKKGHKLDFVMESSTVPSLSG